MQDSLGMRGVERVGDLDCHVQRGADFGARQCAPGRAPLLDVPLERLALE